MTIDDIHNFKNLSVFARQLVEGFITGKHKSPYHGFSVEFAEHKLYNPGESTKNIDWRVFARTDRLYTKRYEEETNLRSHIIMDTSSSMFYPSQSHDKIRYAVYGAASLAYLLFKQRDAFSLTTFDTTAEFVLPAKSTRAHLELLFNHLEEISKSTEQKGTRIADNLHQIASKLAPRSLVVLFSDMFDPSAPMDELLYALKHFRYMQQEVILFHLNHADTELNFNFSNRPYRFTDVETGSVQTINPTMIRNQYLQAIEDYYNALKITCGQMKIDFVEVDVNKDLDFVLLEYLIKRAKMRKKRG